MDNHGGESYDLKDHQEIASAYEAFLDKWNFRQAFPTTEQLFSAIGDKCYEFWGRVFETVRLSESNDILSISGWESTAIENHSGLVDNMRNFKGNPELISMKLQPLLPVVEPRGVVFRIGETPVLDLFLLNETGKAAGDQLKLTLIDAKQNTVSLGTFPVPTYVQDQFVYPVKLALNGIALQREGEAQLDFELTQKGKVISKNVTMIYVVNVPEPTQAKSSGSPSQPPVQVGIIGDLKEAQKQFQGVRTVVIKAYQPGTKSDLIAAFVKGEGVLSHLNDGSKIKGTEDDPLFYDSIMGRPGDFKLEFKDLPKGPIRVSFYFSEPLNKSAGQRIFSLDANGKTVVKDLDIYAEGHGDHSVVVKTVTVEAPNGTLEIAPSKFLNTKGIKSNARNPMINAIKIEADGKVQGVSFGALPYTDKAGLVWKPYLVKDLLTDQVLVQVKSGTPLLVMVSDPTAATQVGQDLDQAGAFKYLGIVGASRQSWMGSWFFVREHPVYSGLPVNTVMKGFYQIPAVGECGLMVDGSGVDVIVGYSRDHDRHVGAATFTSKLGSGKILFQTINNMQPIMQQRWMLNAVDFLKGPQ